MRERLLFFLALLCPALLLCSCGNSWAELDTTQFPTAAEFDDQSDVVFLRHESRIELKLVDDFPVADTTYHAQILVLREAGKKYADLALGYDDHYTEILDFKARVHGPNGQSWEYTLDDLNDYPAFPSWILFADSRVRHLTLEGVVVGSFIEYEYTRRKKDLEVLEVVDWHFGGTSPMVSSRLDIQVPSGWTLEKLEENGPIDFAQQKEGAFERWTWKGGKTGRTGWRETPRVLVRLATWQNAGQAHANPKDERALSARVYELTEEQYVADERVRRLFAGITEGVDDTPEAIARRVFSWVRDHIAYCAIEIGEGGYIPHEAGASIEFGYGDCKDKATLVKSLLDVAGIPSRPILIHAHNGLPSPFGLPTIGGNFNHQIVVIDLPSGSVFADPTAKHVPFGELPWSDQGNDVLPVTEEGSALEHIPMTTVDDNLWAVSFDGTLDVDGGVVGSFEALGVGTSAHGLRGMLQRRRGKKQLELLADEMGLRLEAVNNLTADGLELGDGTPPIKVSGSASFEPLHRNDSGYSLVSASEFFDEVLPEPDNVYPGAAWALGFPKRTTQTVSLALPLGSKVSALPEAVTLELPEVAHYELSWSATSTGVEVKREMVVLTHSIGADARDRLRDFVRSTRRAEAALVLFRDEEDKQ